MVGTYNGGSAITKIYISTDRGKHWKTEFFPSTAGSEVEIVSDSLVFISSARQIYRTDINCKVFNPVGPEFTIQEMQEAPSKK
ncbi:MAG: hypothetical protein IPN18_10995 [Ignavibacteriales bacterium]|nr:hypothetical protein [Ignavibacteriales bacterium]